MPKSAQNKPGISVTRKLLRGHPLPVPGGDDDKDERGRVLVVGGEVALPGALVLAGIAALRAGAGKLQIATCRSIAVAIGVAVPESLSLGLDETEEGTIDPSASKTLCDLTTSADSVLIGPGMRENDSNSLFTLNVIADCKPAALTMDAGALAALRTLPDALLPLAGNAVLTPHAGEMASILGCEKPEVDSDAPACSIYAAAKLGAVIVLKGSRTLVATPDGDLFRYESGDVGLATSGSGDTLAGITAGLLARGAAPLDAALWAVFLHGAAGNRLAKKLGRIGYLARELLDEIPIVMNRI